MGAAGARSSRGAQRRSTSGRWTVASALPHETPRPCRSRLGRAIGLCTLALAASGGACALQVTSAPPAADSIGATSCVAVLPFVNQTTQASAGDLVAEMLASALVVSDRYNVVEPAEVRALLDARGLPLGASGAPAKARMVGDSLGVDAVFAGTVFAYDASAGPGRDAPVAFSSLLVDVRNGKVLWDGEAKYDARDSLPPPVLAGLAQNAADALVRVINADRRGPAARAACAKPKMPALAAKTLRRTGPDQSAPTALAALLRSPPGGAATAPVAAPPVPAASGAATAGTVVAARLAPSATPAAVATSLAGPASAGAAGAAVSRAAGAGAQGGSATAANAPAGSSLPPLPDLPPVAGAGGGSRATPGPFGAGTAPTPLPALPEALPPVPGAGADELPALPSAQAPGHGHDAAALPDIPGLPPSSDSVGTAPVDEYAGLPYSPAAPEPPPAVKAKLSGPQKSLLRQVYVGTGITRRWFRRSALQGNARAGVADFAGLLKAVPDLKLAFEVHADVGNATQRSKQLSDQQLAALQKLIEAKYPFARGRVFFRSMGNGKPISKDITARARAQNTRVEVRRVY